MGEALEKVGRDELYREMVEQQNIGAAVDAG